MRALACAGGKVWVWCALVAGGLASAGVRAQPLLDPTVSTQDALAPVQLEVTPRVVEEPDWQAKAKALDAFVEGRADANAEASTLFSVSRSGVERLLELDGDRRLQARVAMRAKALAERFKQEDRQARPRKTASQAMQDRLTSWQRDPFLATRPELASTKPIDVYVDAVARYFAQPQARQDAMWRAYSERPDDQRPRFDRSNPAQDPQALTTQLQALLRGEASGELELDAHLALDLRRDGRFLWSEREGEVDTPESGQQDPRRAYYDLAQAERARVWNAYQARRQALRAAKAQAEQKAQEENEQAQELARQAEQAAQAASEVERQRSAALAAAREAKSTAARLAAQERARLLEIRAQQEQWSQKINQWRRESQTLHDETMGLVQTVAEYEHKEITPAMAGDLYARVDAVQGQARERLRERLSESLAGSTSVAQDMEQVGEMPPLTVDKEQVERLRFEILERATQLEQLDREVAWQRMTTRHEDLMALNRARLSVLARLGSDEYATQTGISASGWKTVVAELSQMRLELEVRWLRMRRRLGQLRSELAQRATAIVWAVLQLALLVLAFRWWRRRGQSVLLGVRASMLEKRRDYPIMGRVSILFWYLIKIRSPLEWWILGWVVAQLWIGEEWVEATILWTIYKWVVGGVLVVSLLNAIAVQGMGRSRNQPDKTRGLRIDTLRMICFTGTAMGLLLALAQQLVGRGAFYRWVRDGAWMIYIPMAVYLLIRWKPTVYERCERISATNPIPRWVVRQDSPQKSVLGTIVGALYLIYQGAVRRVRRLLMGLESVRKAAAFLLRREVMSNAQDQETGLSFREHPMADSSHFDPDALAQLLLPIGPASRIEGLISSLDEGRSALVGVVGERGAGKTSFLTRLVTDSDARICDTVIDCPAQGLSALYEEIGRVVGAEVGARPAFEAALQERGVCVLCVDNLHRLIRPTIGGLADLDNFIAFARGWSHRLSWVVAMGASAWRYTKRARGNRVFFDELITLRPWDEQEIAQLIDSRNQRAQIDPDFSALKLSRPEDEFGFEELDPEETQAREELQSNRRKYYRILWEYSDGNPGVALHAWRRSIFERTQDPDNNCVVRVFPNPDLGRIEQLSLPALFTLRAIVQLELATEAEVVECTNLGEQDCADAIRVTIAAGYVIRQGPWLRIRWEWHRAIVTVLFRQHLLAAS